MWKENISAARKNLSHSGLTGLNAIVDFSLFKKFSLYLRYRGKLVFRSAQPEIVQIIKVLIFSIDN